MRTLTVTEYTEIAGGGHNAQAAMAIMGTAGFIGGIATASMMSAMGPLATFVGTPAAAIGLGILCTPVAPIVGTIGCGVVGGVLGYYLSSSFATLGGFVVGGAASAYLAYSHLKS